MGLGMIGKLKYAPKLHLLARPISIKSSLLCFSESYQCSFTTFLIQDWSPIHTCGSRTFLYIEPLKEGSVDAPWRGAEQKFLVATHGIFLSNPSESSLMQFLISEREVNWTCWQYMHFSDWNCCNFCITRVYGRLTLFVSFKQLVSRP